MVPPMVMLSPPGLGWREHVRRPRWPALLLIVALHALALLAVLVLVPRRPEVAEPPPLFVSFMAAPPAPQVQPAKPVPVKPETKPKPKPHEIATTRAAAATVEAEEVEPPPPVEAAAEAAPAAAAPPLPPVEQPAPPIIPPNFVAAYLDNPAPQYPRLSQRLHESGQVLLRVLVNAQGRCERAELEHSSGYQRLDDAALEVVHRWRFVAARQGERAVAAWVLVPINFQLEP